MIIIMFKWNHHLQYIIQYLQYTILLYSKTPLARNWNAPNYQPAFTFAIGERSNHSDFERVCCIFITGRLIVFELMARQLLKYTVW